MRRLIIIELSIMLLACTASTIDKPPPAPVDWRSLMQTRTPDAGTAKASQKERDLTDLYIRALGSPGFVALAPLLEEDAHFTFAGMNDVHGRGLVVKACEALLGPFDERRFVGTRVLVTRSSQAIEWTMTGVHHGTNRPVGFRGISLLWTKDDGSIWDFHLYYDQALMKAQIGEGPKALSGMPIAQAPEGERTQLEQIEDGNSSPNLDLVRSALAALENDDPAGYSATMTDDVEVVGLQSAIPIRGKAAARSYVRAMNAAIAGLDTTIDNGWNVGPYTVAEYHVVGEVRGPIGWVAAPKDSLIELFIVDVVEVHDGRIARIFRYDNPSQIESFPDGMK